MPSKPIASIRFVTGKGGVGKTTIAAAIASSLAATGARVLVVETLGSGALRQVLEESDREISTGGKPSVEILELTTVDSLTEYVHLKLRVPATLLRPLARLVDFVAMAAPGVREILTIGKICHEARTGQWDHIVVDGPSTGHIIEMLNAPAAIATVAPSGPLSSETDWIEQILERESSSVVLVALPEQLSSTETSDLANRVVNETKVAIGGLVLNRVASPLSESSLIEIDELHEGPLQATAVLAAQRHNVGVTQRDELAKMGVPLSVVADAVIPLSAAIADLAEVEWLTGTA